MFENDLDVTAKIGAVIIHLTSQLFTPDRCLMTDRSDRPDEAALLEHLRRTGVPYRDQGELGKAYGWSGGGMWRKYEAGRYANAEVLARMVFVAGGSEADLRSVGRNDAAEVFSNLMRRYPEGLGRTGDGAVRPVTHTSVNPSVTSDGALLGEWPDNMVVDDLDEDALDRLEAQIAATRLRRKSAHPD